MNFNQRQNATRCSHICAGHNGVRHHQSKNQTCAALTDAPPPLQSRSSYLDRRIPSTAPSPFDDDALLSLYSGGLFTVHRTWSDKLYSVAFRLITIIIVENRASTSPIASLAFTLLRPGSRWGIPPLPEETRLSTPQLLHRQRLHHRRCSVLEHDP